MHSNAKALHGIAKHGKGFAGPGDARHSKGMT
jgi:hypothetical protein